MSKRPLLSPEREAELLKLFSHHSDAVLSERFGLTVRQVQHLGHKNGYRKTADTRRASRRARHAAAGPTLAVRAEQVVAAAGRAGLLRVEVERQLPEVPPSSIASVLNKLTAHRHLHRAGSKGRSRWFAQAEWATEFRAAELRPVVKPTPALKPNTPVVTVAATRGPAQQPGAPRITAQTVITRGAPVPGPEGRWHTRAQPIFAALKPGQYLDEPSAWAAAATGATP